MSVKTIDYPLIIIGAGAAGLGASEHASKHGIAHTVLEASHRLGGRGLTEYLDDTIAIDMGCHWMHSASQNPYRDIAQQLGYDYTTDAAQYQLFRQGSWQNQTALNTMQEYESQAYENILSSYKHDPSTAISEVLDLTAIDSDYFCHWMSLMHSNDVDQVAVQDVIEFVDTYEDYPVKQGYGALIARQGQNCPVELNTEVTMIDYRCSPIKVHTNRGVLLTHDVIVTVSTGVLAANQIEFLPKLPLPKQQAISALPMGNSNYLFFSVDKTLFPPDVRQNIRYQKDNQCWYVHLFPFDTPCVFTSTGGRYAWWLEKQSPEMMQQLFIDVLVDIFGRSIKSALKQFKHSAWGFDPWIRGAYSSQLPGYQNMREILASCVDEKLYFAGEATSKTALNTAHGAYLSGQAAVAEIVEKGYTS